MIEEQHDDGRPGMPEKGVDKEQRENKKSRTKRRREGRVRGKGWLVALLIAIGGGNAVAQEVPDIEKLLEECFDEEDAGNLEEIASTLMYLAEHPLSLNSASFEELKQLAFLSDSQVDHILKFRERFGDFRHANELLLVNGLGRWEWENMLPFVEVASPGGAVKVKPRWMLHELFVRARANRPRQAGYERYGREAFTDESAYRKYLESRFLGPAWGTMLRYKIRNKRMQAGITLENDAGEGYFTRRQGTGFDFLSGHAMARPGGFVKQVIVGDYRVRLGQGLVAWHGFSAGKSWSALGNEKTSRGAIPYASSDENRFARGIFVATRPVGGVSATLFLSAKRLDARVVEGDSTREATSVDESGYHRNLLEIGRRHALKERSGGASVEYNHARFRVGAHALYYDFSPRLQADGPGDDTGKRRLLGGVSYKSGLSDFYLFGETAVSDNGSLATLNGLRYTGVKSLAAVMIYRRYDKRYTSYYSNGFGEYSGTSNEEGLYTGVEATLTSTLKTRLYHDRFRYFSPRYRATAPGSGSETLGELARQGELGEWIARFKRECKPEDERVDGALQTVPRARQEYRLQYNCYRFLPRLESRTRVDYIRYAKGGRAESGFHFYQDFLLSLDKPNARVNFRLAYFDTDSYNTRVHVYERTLLYASPFSAYQGRGYRSYLYANWSPSRSFTLYAKGGVTLYPSRASISSGLARVDGNRIYDFALQVRVKWW